MKNALNNALRVTAISSLLGIAGMGGALMAQNPPTSENPPSSSTTKASQAQEDRDMTAKIRKSIMDDTSLSAAAHSVRVRTKSGKVTLSGTVNSEQEKETVVSKAKEIAGEANVTDNITVSAKAKKG